MMVRLCGCAVAFLLFVVGADAAAQAEAQGVPGSTPPGALSRPQRTYTPEHVQALNEALQGKSPLLGAVGVAALDAAKRYAAHVVKHPVRMQGCASIYTWQPEGDRQKATTFAAYGSGSVAALDIGGVDIEMQSVVPGAGLIDTGSGKLVSPRAGREVVLQPEHAALYQAGVSSTVKMLFVKRAEGACAVAREGCRQYQTVASFSRYDMSGPREFPHLTWIGEHQLGQVQIEVVCGHSRRTGDPFFTVPWYEIVVGWVMNVIGGD